PPQTFRPSSASSVHREPLGRSRCKSRLPPTSPDSVCCRSLGPHRLRGSLTLQQSPSSAPNCASTSSCPPAPCRPPTPSPRSLRFGFPPAVTSSQTPPAPPSARSSRDCESAWWPSSACALHLSITPNPPESGCSI